MVASGIFREYDLRGWVDRDLSVEVYEQVGSSVGTFLRRRLLVDHPSVTVGRDARSSSAGYQQGLMAGLVGSGCQVQDIGQVPTPVVSFAHLLHDTDAGVVVTASHNPREYNGLKLRMRGTPLHGRDLVTLFEQLQAGDLLHGQGSCQTRDVSEAYLDAILARVRLERPLPIGLDTGNGVAGPLALELYRRLGCDVHGLYLEPDGRFPHHLADPTIPALMADLSRRVVNEGLEVGIGLDGDGDRVGVVDETGTHWQGDRLLMYFARSLLGFHPGRTVVFDVKCSQDLIEGVEHLGGVPMLWKTGYPLIGAKMRETRAVLAGELSGHFYFADNWLGFDDGLFAGARLLEMLSRTPEPLSIQLPTSRRVSTPELRLACPDEEKFRVVAGVTRAFQGRRPVLDIDGVRISFERGWGLLRASNTQPALIARFEASDQDALYHYIAEVQQELDRVGGPETPILTALNRGGGDH